MKESWFIVTSDPFYLLTGMTLPYPVEEVLCRSCGYLSGVSKC